MSIDKLSNWWINLIGLGFTCGLFSLYFFSVIPIVRAINLPLAQLAVLQLSCLLSFCIIGVTGAILLGAGLIVQALGRNDDAVVKHKWLYMHGYDAFGFQAGMLMCILHLLFSTFGGFLEYKEINPTLLWSVLIFLLFITVASAILYALRSISEKILYKEDELSEIYLKDTKLDALKDFGGNLFLLGFKALSYGLGLFFLAIPLILIMGYILLNRFFDFNLILDVYNEDKLPLDLTVWVIFAAIFIVLIFVGGIIWLYAAIKKAFKNN